MTLRLFSAIVVATALAGCGSATLVVSHREPPRQVVVRETGEPHTVKSAKRLGIPPGHLPPPGMCRIWYPGRPPGHQPRPGNCATLSRRVPSGAWLVSRDGAPGRVRVYVYGEERSGAPLSVRVYSASDGRLLEDD